jgi:hypothetical protein
MPRSLQKLPKGVNKLQNVSVYATLQYLEISEGNMVWGLFRGRGVFAATWGWQTNLLNRGMQSWRNMGERNIGVIIVSPPPSPPSHDLSINSEAEEFCCNQLLICVPFHLPPVDSFSPHMYSGRSTAKLGEGGLGSKL